MNNLTQIFKKAHLSRAAICGLTMGLLPLSASAQGWPSNYEGVMLQGFFWDSFNESQWTNLESQADELTPYFKLVWVPQSAYCGGKSMGYNDLYWFSNYDSSFGTEQQLRSMIGTFRQKGIGTIADVVINHRGTLKSWFDFPEETYKGVTYKMTSQDVCADDDGGKAATAAQSQGVKLSANKDTGEGWDGMRDLDHNSANVQTTVKAYLGMLLSDFGYAGFRYDMTKGYAGKFTGIYNTAAKPTYSVGEYWDGNASKVKAWIDATKVDEAVTSAAFDFPIRYSVRDAANGANWTKLANGGIATDEAYRRYAVTFVENHDTEKRSDSSQDPITADTLAANAYILAMPGTPCVFYKHWIDCKRDIKNMIMLRNTAGINNMSAWTQEESSKDRYVLTSEGCRTKLRAAVGKTANSYDAGNGWALMAEGYHWRYFLPTTAEKVMPSLASGIYYNEPQVVLRAATAKGAQIVYTLDGTEPTAQSRKAASGEKLSLPNGIVTLKTALLTGNTIGEVVTRTYDVRKFSPYDITVYVNTDNVKWSNTYFWTWGGDGTHTPSNTSWPGDNVTTTVAQNGKNWFAKSFSINSPSDFVSFVFAQSNSVQTVDVAGITSTSYFEVLTTQDNQGHYYVKNVTADQPTAITDIVDNDDVQRPTTVVALDGSAVRRFSHTVSNAEAVSGLAAGLYIVNGKKIAVK